MASILQLLRRARGQASVPPPGTVGPDNRRLQTAELYALADLYWPLAEIEPAVQIALCESGGWTGAWNLRGEDSRGLWQINVGPGAHPELASRNLFDPQINAFFAAQIWRASGWRAWYNCARKLRLI